MPSVNIGEYTGAEFVYPDPNSDNDDIRLASETIINVFDIETEMVKDEITGKEREVLNVQNKVEDVTNALLTMARGSTRSEEVNEITKQIIAEAVAEEYQAAPQG